MTSRLHIALACAAVLGATVALTGCEEMVDAQNTTDYRFTMYGIFNPLEDRQSARIFPIENLLEVTQPEPIDARVFSTDLATEERIEWRDSLILFDDGSYGHVYWTDLRPEFERTYHLQVIRSDGISAEARTTVPPLTAAEVTDPDSTDFDLIGEVFWPDAPSVIDIQFEYLTNVGVFSVRYFPLSVEVAGGRVLPFAFREDTRRILETAFFSNIDEVYIDGVVIRSVVASEDWTAPDGMFDENFLVEPGTFTNVTDGFGFVGSGYETSTLWVPSNGVLRAGGFDIRGD